MKILEGLYPRKRCDIMASQVVEHSPVTKSPTLWSVLAYENPSDFCKSLKIFIVVLKQPFLVSYTKNVKTRQKHLKTLWKSVNLFRHLLKRSTSSLSPYSID
jgi:hypothetical protein